MVPGNQTGVQHNSTRHGKMGDFTEPNLEAKSRVEFPPSTGPEMVIGYDHVSSEVVCRQL